MKPSPIGTVDKSGRFIKTKNGWESLSKRRKTSTQTLISTQTQTAIANLQVAQKKLTLSVKEFYLKKAIEIAKLPLRKMEKYSNVELKRILESFFTEKMSVLKERFGEKDFTAAFELVANQGYFAAQEILEEEVEEVPAEEQEISLEEK